jgi:hypothetical protein
MSPPISSDRLIVQQRLQQNGGAALWVALPSSCATSDDCAIAIATNGGEPVHVAANFLDDTRRALRWVPLSSEIPSGASLHLFVTRGEEHVADRTITLRRVASTTHDVVGHDRFSFLTTSCNEPFAYESGESVGHIRAAQINSYNLFRRRVLGEIDITDSDGVLRPAPSLSIGLGDQIYVDPDPKAQGHGVAFFGGDRSDQWFVNSTESPALFDVVYRYNWSIPPLADALEAIPSVSVWDDHEIRDGWGSQGDEHLRLWRDYYESAQHAFQAYERSNHEPTTFDLRPRVHVFLTDPRSHREWSSHAEARHVLGDSQFERLSVWLSTPRPAGSEGHLYVIGLGAPISRHSRLGQDTAGALFGSLPETQDDIRDSWGENQVERARLANLLRDHVHDNPNDRFLLLAGDIHESGLAFLQTCTSSPCDADGASGRTIGWEVISSGIANDTHEQVGSFAGAALEWNDVTGALNGDGDVWALARGSLRGGPSFVEIFLDVSANSRSVDVAIMFYPSSGDAGDAFQQGRLANLASSTPWESGRSLDYWSIHQSHERTPDPRTLSSFAARPLWIQLPNDHTAAPYQSRLVDGTTRNEVHAYSVGCLTDVSASAAADHWYDVGSVPLACVTPRAR